MKKLTDLEFYVPLWDWNAKSLKMHNLFKFGRVLRGVALYKTGRFDKFYEECKKSPLFHGETYMERWTSYCFGSTWGRVEYEFGFGDPFMEADGSWNGEKTDIYTAFIKPNAKLLKQMVDEVSVASCKKWLKENK